MKFILRRALPSNFLNHLQIAVIGLGDSTYAKFNFVAKKLYKRLLQLGAKEYFPHAYADEQHPMGIEGTSIKWVEGLFDKLMIEFPCDKQIIPEDALPPPRYKVIYSLF